MITPLHDTDFDGWAKAQAAALRAKDWTALNLGHLAEEIESLSCEQEHVVESHLNIQLLHLLKWRYQPERQGKSWMPGQVALAWRSA